MQPLISPVDHESRTNSHRDEDEVGQSATEDTPLLHRFPRTRTRTDMVTIIVVGFLILILLAGVTIGIYLLVLQSESDNILPPIEPPSRLVTRSQWDPAYTPNISLNPFKAKHIIAVQTDTGQCQDTPSCIQLLTKIKMSFSGNVSFPYNFLISSDGLQYEGLGGGEPTPLYVENPDLCLAFIGNFAQVTPSSEQISSATDLLSTLVKQNHLDSNYTIIGKSDKEIPTYLFESLKNLPHWDTELSDKF